MSLEDSLDRLEAAIDALIARAEGRDDPDDAYRRGLTEGLLLSLLMLQARAASPEVSEATPASPKSRRSQKEKPPKPDRDQLDLFKP